AAVHRRRPHRRARGRARRAARGDRTPAHTVDPKDARSVSGLRHLLEWFNDPANWHGTNGVPQRMIEHLVLWAKAMTIAVVLAVPGGLLLGRSRRSGVLTANVAN